MKFTDLKFLRLKTDAQSDPNGSIAKSLFFMIPRSLFEQVKGFDLNIDKVYEYGSLILSSDLTFFYVLINEDNEINGLLWAEISPLDNQLRIHAFSVNKEYQQNMNGGFSHDSEALSVTLEFLRGLQKEHGLDSKIEIVTLRPRAYEKAGWSRSKKILMEIQE